MLRLVLAALLLAPVPAMAGSLNDAFPFPEATYTVYPPSGLIVGHGTDGELSLLFRYSPDPEGGHPLARALRIWGDGEGYQGVILDDPIAFTDFLRFEIGSDSEGPALLALGGGTWDVALSAIHVPMPATWLLLGVAGIGYFVSWNHRRGFSIGSQSPQKTS